MGDTYEACCSVVIDGNVSSDAVVKDMRSSVGIDSSGALGIEGRGLSEPEKVSTDGEVGE